MAKVKTKRNAEIEKLAQKGYSLLEIAKKFNVSRERVRQVLWQRDKDRKEFRRLSKLKELDGF